MPLLQADTFPCTTGTLNWSEVTDDHLFAVSELGATPLRTFAKRSVYALIASNQIACVAVGVRRFVTKRAILDFIHRHEQKRVRPVDDSGSLLETVLAAPSRKTD